jgi:hypothetical protein
MRFTRSRAGQVHQDDVFAATPEDGPEQIKGFEHHQGLASAIPGHAPGTRDT